MQGRLYKVEANVEEIPCASSLCGKASESPTDVVKNAVIEKVDDRLRQCWNRTKCAELGISDHYTHIAVLLIHWTKKLDQDLECWPQVKELRELFETDFRFESKIVELENELRNPQIQLDKAFADFVHDHDGFPRSHLLIVFYTGHGLTYDAQPNELYISGTATGQKNAGDRSYQPRANWTLSERVLDQAHADTLVILDCCSASNVMKGSHDHPRSYELMAASGKNLPTPSGPRSYTAALIASLKELRQQDQQPFTTHDLDQMILKQKNYDSTSRLFNRQPNTRTRHICIAPPVDPDQSPFRSSQPLSRAGYLDLRISFAENATLSEAEVARLVSELCKVSKTTGLDVCDLEWLGFTPCRDSPSFKLLMRTFWARFLFRKAMMRFKQKRHKRAAELELLSGLPTLKRRRTTSQTGQSAVDSAPKRRRTSRHTCEGSVDEVSQTLEEHGPLTPPLSNRGVTPTSATGRPA